MRIVRSAPSIGHTERMTSLEPAGYGGPADIQNAWRVMARGAPVVAQVLVQIAQDEDAPAGARVQASQAILDRVGLSARPEVIVRTVPTEFDERHTQGDGSLSPAEVIRRRLLELAVASADAQDREREVTGPGEIIDAELVED